MNGMNLLATGAIVTLMFATGTSMAQQERGTPPPAEKMVPSGAKQPSAGQNAPGGRYERLDGRTGEALQNRGRPETSGQAPREDQPNRLNGRTSEPRRGETEPAPHEDRRSRTTEENRATGQAPREDGKTRASEQNGERRRTDHEENHGTVGEGAAGTRANINITSEQRTRIHETIIHERNAPRVSSVNFDISIGARIPRGVRFAALPQNIVEIEPAWRGFEYFMIGDEIVIVDPRSLEIVAIVNV
jgi:hypothetical protein